jgi:hypothetical protein
MPKNVFKQIIKVQNLIGEKKTRLNFGLLAGATAVMLLGVVPFDRYLTYKIQDLDKEIQALKPKAAEIKAKIKEDRFAHYTKANPLVAMYPETALMEEARPSFAHELDLLMKNHIQGVWLTKLSFNRHTWSASLEGYALDATQVNEYFDKIAEEKELDKYALKDLSVAEKAFSGNTSSDPKNKKASAVGVRAYHFTIKTKKEGA